MLCLHCPVCVCVCVSPMELIASFYRFKCGNGIFVIEMLFSSSFFALWLFDRLAGELCINTKMERCFKRL